MHRNEIAGLLAIAKDQQGFAHTGGIAPFCQHTAVRRAGVLARAVDVEIAHPHSGDAVTAGVNLHPLFAHQFAGGVGHKRADRRVFVFGAGQIAIHGASASHDHAGNARQSCRFKHIDCAGDVSVKGNHRLDDGLRHTDHRGEVQDGVAALGGGLYRRQVGDIAVHPRHVFVLLWGEVGEVIGIAGAEIIENAGAVARAKNGFDAVRADESGPAGDEYFHSAVGGTVYLALAVCPRGFGWICG